jgi:hypothetical protein
VHSSTVICSGTELAMMHAMNLCTLIHHYFHVTVGTSLAKTFCCLLVLQQS